MRMRGRERRMEKSALDKELAKIEREAMKDYLAHDLPEGARNSSEAPKMTADRAARLAQLEASITADKLSRAATAAAGGAALPPGWSAATNPDGRVYYTHQASGSIQWEVPGQGNQSVSQLPTEAVSTETHGWQEGHNEQGVPYYYNVALGLTQWDRPSSMTVTPHETNTPSTTTPMPSSLADGGYPSGHQVREEASIPEDDVASLVVEAGKGTSEASRDEQVGGLVPGEGAAVVDQATCLGAWTTVSAEEEEAASIARYGAGHDQAKRQKVAWAAVKGESDDEEEVSALDDLKARLPVSQEIADATARHAAAAAAAADASAAALPPPVFAKRKTGGKAGFRKKG
jgi:hypothetical protein